MTESVAWSGLTNWLVLGSVLYPIVMISYELGKWRVERRIRLERERELRLAGWVKISKDSWERYSNG